MELAGLNFNKKGHMDFWGNMWYSTAPYITVGKFN